MELVLVVGHVVLNHAVVRFGVSLSKVVGLHPGWPGTKQLLSRVSLLSLQRVWATDPVDLVADITLNDDGRDDALPPSGLHPDLEASIHEIEVADESRGIARLRDTKVGTIVLEENITGVNLLDVWSWALRLSVVVVVLSRERLVIGTRLREVSIPSGLLVYGSQE